ncbi:MAG TPA: right-handed parallel beta-helix repeat-containing protein [Thermoanaerobaculia bacterium]|nr:right-handed parallel beta-helix repeat-containing protein [Thermoanaerobaculia bacterium]
MRKLIVLGLALAIGSAAEAKTCSVPADHATVQSAFDDAACDPIQIAAGTYKGSFTLHRTVTVHGAGPGVTILDGQNTGRVLTIVAPAGHPLHDPTFVVVLTGLAIQHGNAHGSGVNDLVGGGIADFSGPLVLVDCDVSHNAASVLDNRAAGGGIESLGGDLSLIRTTVTSNTSGGYAGAIDTEQDYTVIADSTISNNSARTDAAGIEAGGLGISITRTTIANNSGHGSGGGIDDEGGPLYIDHSVVTGNTALEYGGGVGSVGGGMTMIACTVSDNTINDGDGGGVAQEGSYLILRRSTISDNSLSNGNGGGLAVNPDAGQLVLIEDCTFTGNSNGGNGGGVFVGLSGASNPAIFDSTIAGNSAHSGGGIFAERSGGTSRLDVAVSVVSANSPGDCAVGALLLSLGHNMAKDSTCPFTASGDHKGTDPKLGPLALSFPGETATLPLLPGSPAIDAGDDDLATATDQRGVPRAGAHPDIGAFEVADSGIPVIPVEELDLRPLGGS